MYSNDVYPVFLKGGVTVSTVFGVIAIAAFLLVLPAVSMTDRPNSRITGTFLFGILLTLFVVGVAGCIAESG